MDSSVPQVCRDCGWEQATEMTAVAIGKKNGTRNNNDNKMMMKNRNNPHMVHRRSSGGGAGKSSAVIVVVVCCWMILTTAATANNNLYEKNQHINYNHVARVQQQPAAEVPMIILFIKL